MTCPICGHHESWQIAWQLDPQAAQLRARFGEHAPYEWRLCKTCANGYPSQPPDRRILQELWALDRADESASAAEKEKKWSHRRYISAVGGQRSYRMFAPLAKAAGRFLDVGCGLGETVRAFAHHGWDAEGIDADPTTAAIHREFGIKARIGQFEDFVFEQRYDIIHTAHAIYFITEPMQFLRLVRERLAPDGLFCIVLADFLASSAAGGPGYIHTFYPTASSMRMALALAGFDVVFSRRLSGSIYIAARPVVDPKKPSIWPGGVLLLYRTQALRHTLLGRPYLLARRLAKRVLKGS